MFKRCFLFLSHIGISQNTPLNHLKQIKLTNQIAFIVLISALPYYFIFYSFNLTLAANVVWLVLISFLLIFVFNHFKKYHYAKMLVVTTQALAFPFYSLYLGYLSGAHLLFIPLTLLPLILYPSNDEKVYRRIGFLVIFSCLIAMSLAHYYFPNIGVFIDTNILLKLNGFAFVTAIGLVLPQVNVFNQSEQKATKKLADSNTKLNKALVDLKESRNAQVLLTQYADYAKLVQRIAHEFKNPLQMLQGIAEVGLKKDSKSNLFKIVLQSVERLNYVIQPMLNYLNTEQNYKFESFDLAKTVNDIVILSSANCNSKQIKISVQNNLKDIYAYGDPKAIGQIFINLITNSIDAIGHNGGRIMIDLINQPYYHNSQEKNGIKVDIIDSGCGIDEAHLKKMFVPYETSKKNKNNVGLGLSIVSKIIEDHNGLIKISSLKGEGTTISIFFPIGDTNTVIVKNETSFLLDDEFFQI